MTRPPTQAVAAEPAPFSSTSRGGRLQEQPPRTATLGPPRPRPHPRTQSDPHAHPRHPPDRPRRPGPGLRRLQLHREPDRGQDRPDRAQRPRDEDRSHPALGRRGRHRRGRAAARDGRQALSAAMTASELEDYLHSHIPLSAAMQVAVDTVDVHGVVLRAPLAPNINHRDTVFGGSASAVAILAAWSLLHTRMRQEGIAARLVIQANTMDYA